MKSPRALPLALAAGLAVLVLWITKLVIILPWLVAELEKIVRES